MDGEQRYGHGALIPTPAAAATAADVVLSAPPHCFAFTTSSGRRHPPSPPRASRRPISTSGRPFAGFGHFRARPGHKGAYGGEYGDGQRTGSGSAGPGCTRGRRPRMRRGPQAHACRVHACRAPSTLWAHRPLGGHPRGTAHLHGGAALRRGNVYGALGGAARPHWNGNFGCERSRLPSSKATPHPRGTHPPPPTPYPAAPRRAPHHPLP